MSRGPGKIERIIMAALEGEPTRIFSTDDLVEIAYRLDQPPPRSPIHESRTRRARGRSDIRQSYMFWRSAKPARSGEHKHRVAVRRAMHSIADRLGAEFYFMHPPTREGCQQQCIGLSPAWAEERRRAAERWQEIQEWHRARARK